MRCFVVNVYDAVNFDIDLNIETTALSNKYAYADIEMAKLSAQHGMTMPIQLPAKIGIATRCRLRGIGIDRNSKLKVSEMTRATKRLVDSVDGMVEVMMFNKDRYNRILVDIYVQVGDKMVNIRDNLIDNYSKTCAVFAYKLM